MNERETGGKVNIQGVVVVKARWMDGQPSKAMDSAQEVRKRVQAGLRRMSVIIYDRKTEA